MTTLSQSAPHVSPVPAELTAADTDHLRLLTVFHYVMAGVTSLFGLIPVIHLSVGLGLLFGGGELSSAASADPAFPLALFAAAFTVIPGVIIVLMQSMAAALVVAGRRLQARRSWMFCAVVAGLATMVMPPVGTVLGVMTLLVLVRPQVRAAFLEMDSLYAS